MLQALKQLPTAPALSLSFNIGCTFDIPTCTWERGERGNWYMVGGAAAINSVAGPPNSFKTEINNYIVFSILNNYKSSTAIVYDTENTLTYGRLSKSAIPFSTLCGIDFEMCQYDENPRLLLYRGADISGEVFFEAVKEASEERSKMRGNSLRTTPFIDRRDNPMRVPPPMVAALDSLSMFQVSAVQDKIYDQAEIGESGNNMGFMRDGAAKTQMFVQMPTVVAKGNLVFNMVAHVGQYIEMDKWAAKPNKLTFSKAGTKTKGVPEKFGFINNNLFEIMHTKPLLHTTTKAPLYPLTASDREQGNDLFMVRIVNTRNKTGPSGLTFNIIVSQSLGVQDTLTEFELMKENGRFGLQGNNTTYQLVLYPEVSLGRTTIRTKIATDRRLRRAMTITSQLLQMHQVTRNMGKYLCTTEELYVDLKAMGYNWNELLDTNGTWRFIEDVDSKNDMPDLSIRDLLHMRAGEYTPYWMKNK